MHNTAIFTFFNIFTYLTLIFFGELSAWTSSGSSHEELVKNLRNDERITSDKVEDAMMKVDRGFFAPWDAYRDSPQQIGFHATISSPHMHAYALEALRDHLKPGAHVLDVGSGSGYLTACFAVMVGPSGLVVGVEHVPELTALAFRNVRTWLSSAPAMRDSHIRLGTQIQLVTGDGRQGWLPNAPYDAIHVGAAADRIPEALLQQLKVGGRLIIPHGSPNDQRIVQIDHPNNTTYTEGKRIAVTYVPLTDLSLQLQPRNEL